VTARKTPAHQRRTFPVTLVLEGEPCLVVGSGDLAAAKATALAEAGAEVVVVAPRPAPTLRRLEVEGRIVLARREGTAEDVEAAALVVFAEDDLSFDPDLLAHARRLRRPVNAADVTKACSVYLPAVVRRGPIQIAISTGGRSPLLAARLRQRLDALLGPEVGALAELLGALRGEVKAHHPDLERRTAAWRRIMDSDVPALLAAGRTEDASARARTLVEMEPTAQDAVTL